jgi:hypothetical protein
VWATGPRLGYVRVQSRDVGRRREVQDGGGSRGAMDCPRRSLWLLGLLSPGVVARRRTCQYWRLERESETRRGRTGDESRMHYTSLRMEQPGSSLVHPNSQLPFPRCSRS